MDLFALPDWTIWGLIAAFLLIVEMLTVAYVALGFAVGAAVAGLVIWLVPGLHIFVQGLIWASVGLVVWLGLSRWNSQRRAKRRDINDFDSRDALPPSERSRPQMRAQGESD